MRFGAILTAITVIMSLQFSGAADTLTLRSGETLTGSLVSLARGTVAFRSKIAGKAFYPADEIVALSTKESVAIALENDTLLVGALRQADGKTVVVQLEGRGEEPLILSQVKQIDVLPSSSTTSAKEASPLKVSVESGYRWRDGTESRSGIFAKTNIDKSMTRADVSAEIEVEYLGDDADFGRFFRGEASVQTGQDRTWRPEVSVELERDRDQGISLRGDVAAGAVRNIGDTERYDLDVGLGVGVSAERTNSAHVNSERRSVFNFDSTRNTQEEIFADLTFRYGANLFRRSQLTARLRLRPSLTDVGESRLDLRSAITFPVSPRLFLRMDFEVDYDSDPTVYGVDDWRTTFGASMGLRF